MVIMTTAKSVGRCTVTKDLEDIMKKTVQYRGKCRTEWTNSVENTIW